MPAKERKNEIRRRLTRTSFPGAMLRRATRCSLGSSTGDALSARGKTMTALGSHEWFTNAIEGETQIPIGASAGVVSVKVLVVNCVRVS